MRQAAVCVAVVALGLAMGCKPKADAPVTQMSNLDGNARLSPSVVPLSYDLSLRIDPRGEEEGSLSGRAVIRVRVDEPTSKIAMHAEGMTLVGASIDGERVDTAFGKNGGLELGSGAELGVGEHVLELSWAAGLDGAPEGLYRVKSGDDWYAFTQFEPLEAREAFPCFDEPGFKTPFKVSIEAPDGMMAAANAPSEGAPEPIAESEGFTRYTFAQTKPLPTYLVAFAVGPFGVVEAPAEAIPGVPLRALVPKGKEALASFALAHTPEILANLEGYFGQAYPYEKLDLVAVPNFRFGAMENVGLVTFRESLMLIDADRSTAREQHALKSVTAHELAHMWFGNYVTPTWWDELWLNESFATWMASKVMEELYPESEEAVRRVRGVRWVMGADSLEGTRAIRQPITHGGDVYNAFDGITYGKGAAVLRMTEGWIGEDAMREGVRAYMKANPHGSVETESLMAALDEASGKPVYAVLRTFLDQPGVPMLEAGDVVCGDGGAALAVKQSRYLPAGTSAGKGATWSIPACVKYEGQDGKTYQTCEVLEGEESLIKLESCPAWTFLNADMGGYYMWNTSSQGSPEVTSEAIFASLTRAERIAAVGNLKKLLEAEVIEPGAYFDAVLPQLASSDDLLATEGMGALGMMAAPAREAGELDAYAALVRERVGPLVERLGLEPRAGEAPDVGRLRIRALGTLGRWGQDEWAMGNARGLIGAFTADPDAMPSWRARWVVPLAASRGDERLWEELVAALPRAKSPRARSRVLSGLGSFDELELLERSLEHALTDDVYGSEIWAIYGPAMNDYATRELAWGWFTSRYDAIAAKLGEGALADMPYFGSGFCDDAGRAKVEAFFGPKAKEVDGMKRNLSMVLEGIELCARARGYVREAALERVKGTSE